MLIHLILFALHAAARSSTAGEPVSRTRATGPVVIECPGCGTLGLADALQVETRAGEGWGSTWVAERFVYRCKACNRDLNAEVFAADETGVLHARTGVCEHCGARTSLALAACQACGAV